MLTVSLNLGLLLAAPAILPRVAFDRYSPEVLIGQQPLSSSSPVVRPASGPNAAIHPIALVTDQLSTNRRGWSYEDSSEISEASRSLRKREPPRNQVEKLKQFEARIAKDLSSDDYGYDWVHENAVDKVSHLPVFFWGFCNLQFSRFFLGAHISNQSVERLKRLKHKFVGAVYCNPRSKFYRYAR